ncbi:hypothetical protein APHCRT_1364 [Anaplasma phagocytophilum str. CRT53-1]|uniref:Uncharacterized protein n=1 Tax=Anaplasma phagocytophilum str. CRT53-1 TaxID=1359157 RepID=A0A0F3PSC4_ANAPH|nr:hypothetical protein APHCRT_1364 [Anaplasma phagocytophilum str. CRT53-1]
MKKISEVARGVFSRCRHCIDMNDSISCVFIEKSSSLP